MTEEQRSILKAQIQKAGRAKQVADQEMSALQQMLVLVDARFADPESGLTFDPATVTITESVAVETDSGSVNDAT